MKRIRIGILGLIALMATQAAAKEYDTIAETTYRQVTWADFKGREHRVDRWSTTVWPYIATAIRIDTNEMNIRKGDDGYWRAVPERLEVYAIMDKFLSSAAGATDSRALAHEQLHFDLTEAYARRLAVQLIGVEGRGARSDAASQDLQDKLEKAYDDATEAMQKVHDQYDQETRHGTVKKAQKAWSQRVQVIFAEATADLAKVEKP